MKKKINCLRCEKEANKSFNDIGSFCSDHFEQLQKLIRWFLFCQPERSKREEICSHCVYWVCKGSHAWAKEESCNQEHIMRCSEHEPIRS